MKKLFSLMMFLLLVSFLPAQRVEIRFEGVDGNDQAVQMDSVVVTNVTKNWKETVYAPEMYLILSPMGVEHYVQTGGFGLTQNRPNPFEGETRATLNVTDRGDVKVDVMDISGRVIATRRIEAPQEGAHELRVTLANAGLYFLTARQNGRTSTVKMVSRGNGGANMVEYVGQTGSAQGTSQLKVFRGHPWDFGDEMDYVGYITVDDPQNSSWGQPMQTRAYGSVRVSDTLFSSKTVTLWFPTKDATNCIENNYVVDYDGNYYQGFWMGHQCWMAQNLSSRHYVDGTPIARGDEDPSNIQYSSTTGYYFYPSGNVNAPQWAGLLYNWAAVMHGASASNEIPSGVQGICPNGWHVPSKAEWRLLQKHMEGRYNCSDNEENIAKAMATGSNVWNSSNVPCAPGNDPSSNGFGFVVATDDYCYGFDAYPAGTPAGFLGSKALYWNTALTWDINMTSQNILGPSISYNNAKLDWQWLDRKDGASVRCIRNEQETTPPTVTTDSVRYAGATAYGNAVCYGTVVSNGGAPIVELGVCWGPNYNPTLADNSNTWSHCSPGHFTPHLNNLTEGNYYVRAYAKTAAGTVVYGNNQLLRYWKPSVVLDSVILDPDNRNACYVHGRVTSMGSDNCNRIELSVVCSSGDGHRIEYRYIESTGGFTVYVDSLVLGETYRVFATVSNSAGIVSSENINFTNGACRDQATMFDQDGNEYYTVEIGQQCWMKSNLATTHYADGTAIPMGSTSNPSSMYPYRYCPNNSSSNVLMYGYLYNLPAVMHGASASFANPSGVQGICPNGWHVPSRYEFEQLFNYVRNQSSYVCGDSTSFIAKALASTSGWSSSSVQCAPGNNQSTNNASGFNVMPAGWFLTDWHEITAFHENAWIWTCTNYDSSSYYFYEIKYNDSMVGLHSNPPERAMSVRCVKN